MNNEYSIMVIIDNMSEKLQNSRLKRIDQVKDNLLATVSHDLKTPINNTLNLLERASNSNDIEEIKEFLLKIKKNIQLK